jgi:hypothetical protein
MIVLDLYDITVQPGWDIRILFKEPVPTQEVNAAKEGIASKEDTIDVPEDSGLEAAYEDKIEYTVHFLRVSPVNHSEPQFESKISSDERVSRSNLVLFPFVYFHVSRTHTRLDHLDLCICADCVYVSTFRSNSTSKLRSHKNSLCWKRSKG